MTKRSWQGKSIRTTITLERKLFKDAKALMLRNGYRDNFSAFVEDCVREKKARLERHEKAAAGTVG